jgi:hypothetical protein
MTEEALVTIATFPTAIEASIARGALEAAGIPAFVPDEAVGSFAIRRSVPQQTLSELKVRAGDRDRAVKLLEQAGHR